MPKVSLGLMAHDSASEVRRIIAERMNPDDAVIMLNDSDWVVRYTAAQRVAPEALACLLDDPEPDVRTIAQERLTNYSQRADGNEKPGTYNG